MDSGVRELWLVDPDAHTITCVHSGAAGGEDVLGEDDSLRSDLLPGFTLQVAGVFRH